jgi:hypothetical protein
MFEPKNDEGVMIDFNSYDHLLYKENYSYNPKERAFVKLYLNRKHVNTAYVYEDSEMDGREYVIINHTVEYLDQLNTLPEIPAILSMVLDKYNVTHDELLSKKRNAYIVRARHLYMYLMREIYEVPWSMIGHWTNRTHASIIHAHKAIKDAMDVNVRFRKEMDIIINKIYANEYKHIHSSQRPEEVS